MKARQPRILRQPFCFFVFLVMLLKKRRQNKKRTFLNITSHLRLAERSDVVGQRLAWKNRQTTERMKTDLALKKKNYKRGKKKKRKRNIFFFFFSGDEENSRLERTDRKRKLKMMRDNIKKKKKKKRDPLNERKQIQRQEREMKIKCWPFSFSRRGPWAALISKAAWVLPRLERKWLLRSTNATP